MFECLPWLNYYLNPSPNLNIGLQLLPDNNIVFEEETDFAHHAIRMSRGELLVKMEKLGYAEKQKGLVLSMEIGHNDVPVFKLSLSLSDL